MNVNIGFNPDAFGHAAGLPTILAQAGYQYYVFTVRVVTTPSAVPTLLIG